MLEGNTDDRVMASGARRPGVEGPFALHIMSTRQPVRSQRFLFDVKTNHADSEYAVQAEKARSANDTGKSDDRIVPLKREDQSRGTKPGNAGAGKAVRPSRDPDEHRPHSAAERTVPDRLDRITERAETHPEEAFNNLFSLLTYELLWHAFRRLKRDKAPGVDGVTVDQYEANLQGNLQDLSARLHRGELSTSTQPASRDPERERQDATAGHRLCGGQDRPTSDRDDPGTNLRGRLL